MALGFCWDRRCGEIGKRWKLERWAGDDIRYAVKRKLATLLRDPGLAPGDAMDRDLFPVVWRATQDT